MKPISVIEQLRRWTDGDSVCRDSSPDLEFEDECFECLPDFSCCGSPLAPEERRKAMYDAWVEGGGYCEAYERLFFGVAEDAIQDVMRTEGLGTAYVAGRTKISP